MLASTWWLLANLASASAPAQGSTILLVPGLRGDRDAIEAATATLGEAGWRVVVAPTDRFDPVKVNARVVARQIEALSDRPLVLVSLGRGSPEVEVALGSLLESADHVQGWVNVAGLLGGTPKPRKALGPSRVRSDALGFMIVEPSTATVRSLRESVRQKARAELTLPRGLPTVDYILRPTSPRDPSVEAQRTGGPVVWAESAPTEDLGPITLRLLDVLWPASAPQTASPTFSTQL